MVLHHMAADVGAAPARTASKSEQRSKAMASIAKILRVVFDVPAVRHLRVIAPALQPNSQGGQR